MREINFMKSCLDKSGHYILGCKEVIIKDNVFIGANSIVLKGVSIGENSIVQAGSLVVSDVESNTIYGGNPAVKIKDLNL